MTSPPAPVTAEAAQVLNEAADLIARRGFTQREYEAADGRLCILGALAEIGYGPPSTGYSRSDCHLDLDYRDDERYPSTSVRLPGRRPGSRTAWRAVKAAVPDGDPVGWNDAPGRTGQEAARLLRRTAARRSA